ncbi:MAG TPA: hypothetical protein VK505_10840 [Steroidobacteraceae bacterium]|jgi:hypothetical protein|nr:hypothetical protein [Steroidobacteraceae bacterium]
MTDTATLFRKLNLGTHRTVHVLNAPNSFQSHLAALAHMNLQVSSRLNGPVSFALAFATTQKALDKVSAGLAAAAQGDAILWIAYPKGTSRRYQCEFSRDSGWKVLGAAGFEPVRMVAIDEDWTALRFRRVEHIKSMTREASRTHSREGRRNAQKK